MTDMWWLAGTQDLHRIEDRLSTVYIERCHVDRDDNAVVFVNKVRTIRIPAALVATVLLGPGTRITSAPSGCWPTRAPQCAGSESEASACTPADWDPAEDPN